MFKAFVEISYNQSSNYERKQQGIHTKPLAFPPKQNKGMKLETISHAYAVTIPGWHYGKKVLLIMKLTFLFILAAFLHVSAEVRAQKVTLKVSNTKLERVLENLRHQKLVLSQ